MSGVLRQMLHVVGHGPLELSLVFDPPVSRYFPPIGVVLSVSPLPTDPVPPSPVLWNTSEHSTLRMDIAVAQPSSALLSVISSCRSFPPPTTFSPYTLHPLGQRSSKKTYPILFQPMPSHRIPRIPNIPRITIPQIPHIIVPIQPRARIRVLRETRPSRRWGPIPRDVFIPAVRQAGREERDGAGSYVGRSGLRTSGFGG